MEPVISMAPALAGEPLAGQLYLAANAALIDCGSWRRVEGQSGSSLVAPPASRAIRLAQQPHSLHHVGIDTLAGSTPLTRQ